MKRFFLIVSLAACVLLVGASAFGAWKMEIEDKPTLSPGQNNVTVNIKYSWDVGIVQATLPVVVRTVSGGAFWTGSLPYDTIDGDGTHWVNKVTWNAIVPPWSTIIQEMRTGAGCAGLGDPYDGSSPDNFEISNQGANPLTAQPAGVNWLTMQFDVNNNPGTFEFDTACFTARLWKLFMIDGNLIDHGPPPGTNDVVFDKGEITILPEPPDCNNSRPKTWCASLSPGGESPFAVVVKRTNGQPMVGLSGVYLDFSNCTAQELTKCGDYPNWPIVYGPASDENGEVNFNIAAKGNCPDCTVDIYLPGCGKLATVPVHTFDVNNDGLVTPTDWNIIPETCRDFDCVDGVDGNDLTLFSRYLWSQCPGNQCDLMIASLWTEPADGYSPGDTINVYYKVTNRNRTQSCSVTSLELSWSPLGPNQTFTRIGSIQYPGVVLAPDQKYQYSVTNFEVPQDSGLVLKATLASGCCAQPKETQIARRVIRQCPPAHICLEANLLVPPSYGSLELLSQIPPGWTFGPTRFSEDGDTIIIPFCTSANTPPGTVGTATFVFRDIGNQPILPPITLSIKQDMRSGDCTGDCLVNPLDVVRLVNYVYKSGPPPNPWRSGNVRCPYGEVAINPLDVVWLVNYVYKAGPLPEDCPD